MKVQTQRIVLTGYKFLDVSYFCYIILFLYVQVTLPKEQNIIIDRRGKTFIHSPRYLCMYVCRQKQQIKLKAFNSIYLSIYLILFTSIYLSIYLFQSYIYFIQYAYMYLCMYVVKNKTGH